METVKDEEKSDFSLYSRKIWLHTQNAISLSPPALPSTRITAAFIWRSVLVVSISSVVPVRFVTFALLPLHRLSTRTCFESLVVIWINRHRLFSLHTNFSLRFKLVCRTSDFAPLRTLVFRCKRVIHSFELVELAFTIRFVCRRCFAFAQNQRNRIQLWKGDRQKAHNVISSEQRRQSHLRWIHNLLKFCLHSIRM